MTSRIGLVTRLLRAVRLRCPVCGVGPLFRGFTPRPVCAHCGFRIARGNEYGHEGYYSGAIAINFAFTGVIPLVALFLSVLYLRLGVMQMTIIGVIWTILFPIAFYRHSCALWTVMDHSMNPPAAAELARRGEPDAPEPSPLAVRRYRRR